MADELLGLAGIVAGAVVVHRLVAGRWIWQPVAVRPIPRRATPRPRRVIPRRVTPKRLPENMVRVRRLTPAYGQRGLRIKPSGTFG